MPIYEVLATESLLGQNFLGKIYFSSKIGLPRLLRKDLAGHQGIIFSRLNLGGGSLNTALLPGKLRFRIIRGNIGVFLNGLDSAFSPLPGVAASRQRGTGYGKDPGKPGPGLILRVNGALLGVRGSGRHHLLRLPQRQQRQLRPIPRPGLGHPGPGQLGPGNISRLPKFVRPAWGTTGDYHLVAGSPGIDQGTATGAPLVDLEYQKRPLGKGYDMGAYEFAPGKSAAAISLPLLLD
jgi:hypothetical protein